MRRIAWYPVLLAVAFALAPIEGMEVDLIVAFRPVAAATVAALVVSAITYAFLGRDRGGALAAVVVMALAVATTPARLAVFALAATLLVIEAQLAVRGRLSIRLPWQRVTEFGSVALAIVVGLQVASIAAVDGGQRVVDAPQNWIAAEPGHRPNIWVLLADGHGRADVLEKSYGLDEFKFRSQLTALGLNVSDRSRANHTTTLYSLSTFLNGRPLAELGQDMALPADAAVPPAALRGNSVFGLLRSAGYEIDALDSGFAQVRLSSADHVIDVGPRNELEGIELAQTALGAVIDKVTGVNRAPQGERVLRQVQQLKVLAADSSTSPRFVFAHIPSPHVPYALDDTCAIRTDIDASIDSLPVNSHERSDAIIKAVREQTECVDKLLVEAAGAIVRADDEAVVIIMSDHGPEEAVDWSVPSEPGAEHRFANLFYARTPHLGALFPADVSLVNVFPILFNALWDQALPLHPDDSYVGPAANVPGFVLYTAK